MFELRNVVLGVLAFSLTFGVGWWLGLGKAAPALGLGARPAVGALDPQPALPAAKPEQVAVQTPQAPAPAKLVKAQPPQGKGLTENDGLRQAVILRAKAYQRPACNQDPKTLYVMAATKYAEVLMRSAGCNTFPKCAMGTGALNEVWRLNHSAADRPVAEAMAAVNAAGGLTEKDFRGDVGRAVRVIAGTDFSSGPPPACETATARTGSGRVRYRR